MRKLLWTIFFLNLLLIISDKIFAQKNAITHELSGWNIATRTEIDGNSLSYLEFEGSFSKDSTIAPWLPIQIKGDFNKVVLSKMKYKDLTKQELALFTTNNIKDTVYFEIKAGYENKKPVTFIYILPFKYDRDRNVYQKLVSFSYSYSKDEQVSKIHSSKRTAANEKATTSVLAQGDWYKLEISSAPTETGTNFYKIDYPLLESILTADKLATVDPRNIKLYGNGGAMLPESNATERFDDLQENPIMIFGEQDGKFDRGDYIVFYGKGPDHWEYDKENEVFDHYKNIYSDQAYYFLTIGADAGKRVVENLETGVPTNRITTFKEKLFYEKDLTNLLHSGRTWYGEEFNQQLTRDFSFNLSGLIPNAPVKLTTRVMASSSVSSSFTVSVNNSSVFTPTILARSENAYYVNGVEATGLSIISDQSSESFNVNVRYNKTNSDGKGFLDFLEITYEKSLQLYGNSTLFSIIPDGVNSFSELAINNVNTNLNLWDVTNITDIKSIPYTLENNTALAVIDAGINKEFGIFQGATLPSPLYKGIVPNQNLHAIGTSTVPNLIIVTHESFLNEAQELAAHRESADGLSVAVATTQQIYNEFSSGAQDLVAIRDFVKMVYDRGTDINSLQYLLFFGAGSYDYKNRVSNNANYVPIYQTPNSLHKVESQSSDDYCGFLDINEGEWDRNENEHTLDIGIGRLIIRTPQEANLAVKKLINYNSSKKALGKWRNKVTLVADNKDWNSGINEAHMNDAELMATAITTLSPDVNINKLYLDVYKLESTPSGESSPAFKEALLKEINSGSLIVNYSGHGGDKLWAQEDILNVTDLNVLTNKNRLPFFVTATCDFGVYDDPEKYSGALAIILNKDTAGGIGLLSSTRPVFQISNRGINQIFYQEAFNFSNGKPRLGDLIKNSKNRDTNKGKNKNYALLGDPSLRLAYPEQDIIITSINDSISGNAPDTLKSLSKIKLTGEIFGEGVFNPSFNGVVNISVFDKPNIYNAVFRDKKGTQEFGIQNNVIFEGSTMVKDGKFSIEFTAPKDIAYNYGFGKISMYGTSDNGIDANGTYTNLIIGGSNSSFIVSDTTPPSINLTINDTTFKNGGLTNKDPRLIIVLQDENGINTSSAGIGHEITAVLNDSKETIVLNSYYSSIPGQTNAGIIEYPFYNLAPGRYTVTVKAWDIYNNPGESSISFIVSDKVALEISDAFNAPNPFSTNTEFVFNHNKAGEDLEILLELYSLSGSMIKDHSVKIPSSSSQVSVLNWEGRDNSGMILPSGTYIYRLSVTSMDDQSHVEVRKKLVIVK